MIDCKIDENAGRIQVCGDLEDIASEISVIIGSIYWSLRKFSEADAELFLIYTALICSNPNSPIRDKSFGEIGEGVSISLPKGWKKGEAHEG